MLMFAGWIKQPGHKGDGNDDGSERVGTAVQNHDRPQERLRLMVMPELTLFDWPDGKQSLVFRAIEDGRSQIVCWTPSQSEWFVLRQMLSALSEVRIPRAHL